MGGQGPAGAGSTFRTDDGAERFNLFGWDGTGSAPNLFPERGAP